MRPLSQRLPSIRLQYVQLLDVLSQERLLSQQLQFVQLLDVLSQERLLSIRLQYAHSLVALSQQLPSIQLQYVRPQGATFRGPRL